MGRMDRQTKGLDRLLSVLKKLPPEWICVVAGDGPDRDWLESQIRENNIKNDQVKLLGNVDKPEVWFGIVDAFLFTSKYEPFGLVLLEAAVSELPIISFQCEGGGLELLNTLGAITIHEKDIEKIGSILTSIVNTMQGVNNRKLIIKEYSWKKMATMTLSTYHEILDLEENKYE
jgi:glycosyltransferase involved in cell wall biosynthesis